MATQAIEIFGVTTLCKFSTSSEGQKNFQLYEVGGLSLKKMGNGQLSMFVLFTFRKLDFIKIKNKNPNTHVYFQLLTSGLLNPQIMSK